ncbi:MAG: PilT/PilU family type 4a pilus ATPase [Patescibacteria group bacterium]|nr:PilT/PilU family type 4a pilus ATPase [bacterium]MDZ4240908.1 PilT/PilU family type 4a pilus ATPase [Patescibacteria group bacterium]
MDYKKELEELFETIINEDGSDLHLSEGRHPTFRVGGFLIPLVKKTPLTRADITGFMQIILTAEQSQVLTEKREVDFAYVFKEKARFRGNAFYQQGKISIALRLIPRQIRSLEELGLPQSLELFVRKQQGFFLVVGPTGQGKSTTLATLIDMINTSRLEHIITVEDPIEYVFEPKKSIIDQREVKYDTRSFHTALHSVFRQDVDVLMIGEMRDPETMSTAVTAAETGHLVFSTLHTNTASQTIDRIIDSFPAQQQDQIRTQLSGSLIGIFSQRLIPRISGGLVPAYELLISNSAVSNLIREGRTHEISTVIETSSQEGMIDLNRCLADLVRKGDITVENAFLHAVNQKILERML